MRLPQTLLQMAGANLQPARLESACLVLIDYQNEYLSGPLELSGSIKAIERARQLLHAARNVGTPIFHVVHNGPAGGLFDRSVDRGKIVRQLLPEQQELVIEKKLPNAFANTGLHNALSAKQADDLIIAGFMTHLCVSSTARVALDLGYRVTVDAESCASRDLPDGKGGSIEASVIHNSSLAALADRFAVVNRNLSRYQ